MCKFIGDKYLDEDEVLEQVLRQEREAKNTAQKKKFSTKDFFSKCEQIRTNLTIKIPERRQ